MVGRHGGSAWWVGMVVGMVGRLVGRKAKLAFNEIEGLRMVKSCH
jgi:hypothetical protein